MGVLEENVSVVGSERLYGYLTQEEMESYKSTSDSLGVGMEGKAGDVTLDRLDSLLHLAAKHCDGDLANWLVEQGALSSSQMLRHL